MDTVKICASALIIIAVITVLKQFKSDTVPMIKVAAVLLFAAAAMFICRPIFAWIENSLNSSQAAEYTKLLIKALGIGYLTSVCASVCRDCGESGLADGVETVGKLEILVLALPLICDIIGVANELLEM